MTRTNIADWEARAQVAAAELCKKIDAAVSDTLDLAFVAPADANGTNSLSSDFVDRLDRREHLTDQFLAAI